MIPSDTVKSEVDGYWTASVTSCTVQCAPGWPLQSGALIPFFRTICHYQKTAISSTWKGHFIISTAISGWSIPNFMRQGLKVYGQDRGQLRGSNESQRGLGFINQLKTAGLYIAALGVPPSQMDGVMGWWGIYPKNWMVHTCSYSGWWF